MCLIAVPYGLGAGAIDAALNNYVAVHYSSRHMSWLHCFWGVGTIISPYIMSLALTYASWSTGYGITALVQLSIAFILLATVGVWKVNVKKDTDGSEDDAKEIIGLRKSLRIRGVIPLLIGFFGYCGAEAIAILWSASYLNLDRGFTEQRAAAFTSAFFIGITAGRFVSGFFADRLTDKRLIMIGTAISVSGVLIMMIPTASGIPAVVGLLLTGLGFAPIYPAIIHSTPASFGKKNSQAIIGIQMASAYVGTTLAPPAFGLIADYISIKLFPPFILLFVVIMVIMLAISDREVRRANEGGNTADS
jgi:fucose permease